MLIRDGAAVVDNGQLLIPRHTPVPMPKPAEKQLQQTGWGMECNLQVDTERSNDREIEFMCQFAPTETAGKELKIASI